MSNQCIQSNTCMCSRSQASHSQMKHGHCSQHCWCRQLGCCRLPQCILSNTCMYSRWRVFQIRSLHGHCSLQRLYKVLK